VQGRGGDERAAVDVRRDLHVVGFGHARDLLGLPDAAYLADIEVEDRRGAVLDQAREVELGRQPLAGRDRDRGAPDYFGQGFHVLRRARLLVPERIELLQAPGDPQRSRRGHLAVHADDDVAGGYYLVADGADDPLGGVGRGQGELERDVLAEALVMRQDQRERVDLDRGEAEIDVVPARAAAWAGLSHTSRLSGRLLLGLAPLLLLGLAEGSS
jgi:hypothetical protein